MQRSIFFSSILFLCLAGFSQSKVDASIANIRQTVQQINNASGYMVKKPDPEDFLEHSTDNGAELDGYLKTVSW
jgi:hypothetical protein